MSWRLYNSLGVWYTILYLCACVYICVCMCTHVRVACTCMCVVFAHRCVYVVCICAYMCVYGVEECVYVLCKCMYVCMCVGGAIRALEQRQRTAGKRWLNYRLRTELWQSGCQEVDRSLSLSRMKQMQPEDMKRFQASAESRRRRKKITFVSLKEDTV